MEVAFQVRTCTGESAEAVTRRCSVKRMFLEISRNLQENTCARVSFLIKLQALSMQLYKKRDSGTGILRTAFLTEHLYRLLLKVFLRKIMRPHS